MKLRYSHTSPYARKVRAVAVIAGVADRIELVKSDTWNVPEALFSSNPLGKIPCLIRDGAPDLYDSPVICEYLDSLSRGPRLFPADGEARWKALRLQALGDGMMDAAVERFVEAHRPPEKQMNDWAERQAAALRRALDALEATAGELKDLTIGSVAIACAVGYLDIRFAEDRWREGRPALTAWYEALAREPWMATTGPEETVS